MVSYTILRVSIENFIKEEIRMKMRKIIAVLAAVLMLCSVLPMSAFAADGDVVFSKDFNDGTNGGFTRSVNENGYIAFDATTADWQNTYCYASGFKTNVDYLVTFKAKANKATTMNFKINDNWGPDAAAFKVNVTTEWQDFEGIINMSSLSGAIVMFSSNSNAANAATYYIDDVKIVEYVEPVAPGSNLFVNGDFETGNTNGWNKHQQTTVTADAAKSGSYGAYLKGDSASWGGVLDQNVNVEAGKTYVFSFDYKAIRQGFNYKLTGVQSGNKFASGYESATSWTHVEKEFTVTADTQLNLNFNCGGQTGTDEMYVDNIYLKEVKDPSFDGYIYNGDFETGKSDPWNALWGSTALEIVEGMNGGSALKGTASGSWNITYQEVAVTPNTNYTVWANVKDASASALWIKNAGGNGDITSKNFASGSEWSLTSVTFNSGSNNTVWVGLMGLEANGTYTVDDVFMFEAKEQSNDGYIKNGTFETGSVSPWENLWGSCPTVEIIKGGKDDTFALNLVSAEWKHLRQTGIAVEANTDYKISLWSKNVKNMNLLVKDNGDTTNIVNKGIANSDDWAKTEITFNTGSYTSIIVSFMGGAAEAYGQFDNIVMEKLHTCNVVEQNRVEAGCETDGYIEYACDCGLGAYTETIPAAHTYTDDCDQECDVCSEWRFDAPHNVTYVPGVVPATCLDEGYDEHWQCADCGKLFGDAEASWQVNPDWLYYTGDCVRPENSIPCATVTCTVCGNDVYGEACTRPEGAPACQDVECADCGELIWGEGHSYGYDENDISLIPLCQPGDCIHCGEHLEKIYDCENGSWAPCSEAGECCYGCGKQYPATGIHVFEEGVLGCDGGLCWLCWNEIEAGHVYAHGYADKCVYCDGEESVREVELPIVTADKPYSVSEQISGLAFKFEMSVEGMDKNGNKAVYANAKVGEYTLVSMGAIASNGFDEIKIPAENLYDLQDGIATFAVRIIRIPANCLDITITATPYFVIEANGIEYTVYGEALTNSYNGALTPAMAD